MADYTTYANYVSSICDSGNISGFRVHPSYTYMLEHVSEEVGAQYLDAILSFSSITEKEIIEFCAKNDVVGDPAKYVYDNMCVSPTSLRYIFQAHLVLTHMKATSQLNIDAVELGGGYGGLCLALFHFAPKYDIHIKSYKICDLPDIITLQKLYLGTVDPALPVEFVVLLEIRGSNIRRLAICAGRTYSISLRVRMYKALIVILKTKRFTFS